jgi:tripartite-type tricarboxylate transporter receptor subunit TctC
MPRPGTSNPISLSWLHGRGPQRDQRDALRQLNHNFIRDVTPVASVIRGPTVMVVHPSVPANTVPQFIAYAKANPGRISFGSSGIGSGNHLAGELFKIMAGVDMVHVPYRSAGPALTDLLSRQVQVMFPSTVSSIEYVRAGRLRALAVTTATRSETLPDLPTVGEFVPGYEASTWFGVGAPKATPAEIVEKLNKEINAGLADPKIKARLADLGGGPLALSPAEFGKFIADETEKWGKVIRVANIKTTDPARPVGKYSVTPDRRKCRFMARMRCPAMSAQRPLSGPFREFLDKFEKYLIQINMARFCLRIL